MNLRNDEITGPAAELLQLSGRRRDVALQRSAVLDQARAWLEARGVTAKVGLPGFVEALVTGTHPRAAELRDQVRHLSPRTLRRWMAAFAQHGLAGLAPKGGAGRPSVVDQRPELRDHILRFLADHPHASPRAIHRHVVATRPDLAGPENLRAVQRWLQAFKANERYRYDLMSNPDRAKGRWKVAVGRQADRAADLNDEWEIDGSPFDAMCTDGRFKLVAILDVFSRRGRLLVTERTTSTRVGDLVQRCVREWGRPNRLRSDNGTEYVSTQMQKVLRAIGTEPVWCNPFASEEKGHVERFFRTFQHDLVPYLQGFVGHNVAERQAIEARKSFAQRLDKESPLIEVTLTSAQMQAFCDQWTEAYERRPHAGLGGRSPYDVAAASRAVIVRVPDAAFEILNRRDVERQVTKRGISLNGRQYHSAELVPYLGKTVRVAEDSLDLGRVAVLDEDGVFVCHALDPAFAGVSKQAFAKQVHERQAQHQRELRAQVKALKPITRDGIVNDLLNAELANVPNVTALPKRGVAESNPVLDAAVRGASERAALQANPFVDGRFPSAVRLADTSGSRTKSPMDWAREDAELEEAQHRELRALVELEADESLTQEQFDRLRHLERIPGNGHVAEEHRRFLARTTARAVAR